MRLRRADVEQCFQTARRKDEIMREQVERPARRGFRAESPAPQPRRFQTLQRLLRHRHFFRRLDDRLREKSDQRRIAQTLLGLLQGTDVVALVRFDVGREIKGRRAVGGFQIEREMSPPPPIQLTTLRNAPGASA